MGESSQLWLPFPEVTQLSRQAQVGHPSPTSTGTETELMPSLQCLSDSLLWALDDGERQARKKGLLLCFLEKSQRTTQLLIFPQEAKVGYIWEVILFPCRGGG